MIRPLQHRDALFLSRCVYATLLALLWPFKSPRPLTDLDPSHYHPALGPFAFFDSYPSLPLVIGLETVTFLLLALWITGWGRWMIGLALTAALTTLSGFVYATGKIDHDFVILLIPLLLTLPKVSPKKAILFCLGIYFASSGLAKALSGWLDPNTQASLSWALVYFHVHGKTEVLLEWSLTNLPTWSWEIFDQLTVWFELLVPLAILPRLRPWIFLAVPLFHFGTIIFFGIDFTRLFLVYIPLTLLCCAAQSDEGSRELSKRTRTTLLTLCSTGLLFAFLHLWFRGTPWSLPFPINPPGLILFPLFEALLITGFILRSRGAKEAPHSR
jgi:hypothetical protein